MRAYLRLDPHASDRKAEYPDGAFRAFFETLCHAEQQPQRGIFRNRKLLAALLDKRRRWIPYLIEHGDLIEEDDGRLLVDGWAEWQEGDLNVAERMRRVRRRHGEEVGRSPGADRTARYRLRTRIFERDHYTCRYCGMTDYPRDWLVLEHVVPDGPTDEANLVTACRPCNKRKGGRTPEEAGMPLRDVSQVNPRNASPPPVTPSSGGGSGRHSAEAARRSDGSPTFMGYRPKPGLHDGQHGPTCMVCAPPVPAP